MATNDGRWEDPEGFVLKILPDKEVAPAPEEGQLPVGERWDLDVGEDILIIKADGTQVIHHPDGSEEVIKKGDPRYNLQYDKGEQP